MRHVTLLVFGLLIAPWLSSGLAMAAPPPPRLAVHDAPPALPEFKFQNEAKEVLTLADFRGRIVVLNLWATWCPPCREEMPTLDALQGELGSDRFEVVALSIDRAGPRVVRRFYDEIGIQYLRLYIDPDARATGILGIPGIPTTLIIDTAGREVGRLTGAADWASPEMLAYFRDLIEAARDGENP